MVVHDNVVNVRWRIPWPRSLTIENQTSDSRWTAPNRFLYVSVSGEDVPPAYEAILIELRPARILHNQPHTSLVAKAKNYQHSAVMGW